MPLEGSRERITYIQPHDIISKGKHYLHSEVGQIMTTKLERISELSKQHPEMKFNSIGHLINIEMLKECHYKMDGRKAVGIDGISKEEYNSNLDNNLKQLVEKLKNKSYRPKPARKVEIPKENGKTRPLGIPTIEDRLKPDLLVSIHMKINWFRKHLGKFWNRSLSPISTAICAASDQTATAMEL